MIKYNLKKILLEEDELDLVDTSFFSKYDKVPDRPGPYQDSPEWDDYHADKWEYVSNVLGHHLKDHSLSAEAQFQIDNFLADYEEGEWVPDSTRNDHIENSRADTWIKDFHMWLGNM